MIMKRLETIITDERNIGLDFIVHVQNKKELEELAAEDNYDTCFRIRNREQDRCIACHPSVEHWRIFTKDILEIQNGNLQYNEGDYSSKAAAIEAEKVWNAIHDKDSGSEHLKLFGLREGITKDEIMQWVLRDKK